MTDGRTDRHTLTAYTALALCGRNGSRDPGFLCHCVALDIAYLFAQFEDSSVVRFRDTKKDAERKNKSGLWRLGSSKVIIKALAYTALA